MKKQLTDDVTLELPNDGSSVTSSPSSSERTTQDDTGRSGSLHGVLDETQATAQDPEALSGAAPAGGVVVTTGQLRRNGGPF